MRTTKNGRAVNGLMARNSLKARNGRQQGIFIPAGVVRATLGALAVAVAAIVLAEAPEIWRYYKLETM